MDGWGHREDPKDNAIAIAKTPNYDLLLRSCPTGFLATSSAEVGLPEGQMGNSEVGHMNLGAGRTVRQALPRIDAATDDGFANNDGMNQLVTALKDSGGTCHLLGLLSPGGVHSHMSHLGHVAKAVVSHGIPVLFHIFTDGRDAPPQSALEYLDWLHSDLAGMDGVKIATVTGRYFTMDRDNRWERVQLGYDLLVNGNGEFFESADSAFDSSYSEGITDEFIKPILLDSSNESRIQKEDAVIFYNIRGDRAREISRALNEKNFSEFEVKHLNLHYATFTSYDETFDFAHVAYPPQELKNTLGEWVSKQGKKQFRIAETEKYPHVTYFFNGGNEVPNEGEDRLVIPSPKVATYDLQPEMNADQVANALCERLNSGTYDLIILNFANPDMVGHTGIMDAAIKAVETIDRELKKVIETANANGYTSLIIADHGNADQMIKPDGSPHTAHTTALVPAILVNHPESPKVHPGILADVAPTLLKCMNIDQPEEMSGTPLF